MMRGQQKFPKNSKAVVIGRALPDVSKGAGDITLGLLDLQQRR